MLFMRRFLPLILFSVCFAATQSAAQVSPEPPLRVGIVGLVHGHVKGFLEQSLHNPAIKSSVCPTYRRPVDSLMST